MMRGIIDAAREKKDTGFVVSLKESFDTYKMVADAALPNVLLRPFVPQLELLNDSRMKAFISHGGGNSILESMYYGVPLIGAPIDADQYAAAYRVSMLGIGVTLGSKVTKDTVIDAINQLCSDGSKQRKAIKRVQSMIHFKELRSGKDMAYLMRRAVKFDNWSNGKCASHLVNRQVFDNS